MHAQRRLDNPHMCVSCLQQQALVVQGFRSSAIDVLIATSVGSEGMDFRQCQLVVAFDLPKVWPRFCLLKGLGVWCWCRVQGSRGQNCLTHPLQSPPAGVSTSTPSQQDVTSYIQCRGRARKRGSRYCFMQAQDLPHSIQHIIM